MNKILLIDDEPLIVMLFKTLLEAKGYTLSIAMTGTDGLKMAKEILPGLIILDYQLPDMNGTEVYNKLKKSASTKHIPVILCTADLYQEEIGRLKQSGCKVFEKPLRTKEFLKEIQSLLPLTH